MSEEWRAVVGWKGFYEVSNLGFVRSLDRWIEYVGCRGGLGRRFISGKILKGGLDSYGYHEVTLSRGCGTQKNYLVHQLVLGAFGRERLPNEQADHKNGKRADNRLSNLRWAIPQDQGRNRHHIRNRTGFIGVSENPKGGPNPYWAAARDRNGKKVFLGMHPTAEAAGAAYLNYRETQYSHV